MAVELMAEQDGAVFLPVVVGSVQWETWMSGSPGRLTFTVLEEEGFPALREGCRISLRLDGRCSSAATCSRVCRRGGASSP